MKLGFKFLISLLSGGVSLCALTSIPLSLTNDINMLDFSNKNFYLKNKISYSGTINQILKGDSRSESVNTNLNKIFNFDKKSLFENFNTKNDHYLDTLTIQSQILNWNNWGNQTFNEWKGELNITEINYTKDQIIDFKSKNQLRNYLENNIHNLINNYSDINLADAEFTINSNGDLLIPVTTSMTNYSNSSQVRNNTNKAAIKIPSSKINFNPEIQISGTYGINNEFHLETTVISLTCDLINLDVVPIVFNSNSSHKKEITLDEKVNTENDITLWDNITDQDIFKKLNWTNNELTSNDLNISTIDTNKLDTNAIYNDLEIDKSTNEIVDVRVEFKNGENSRNPKNNNYNGEYKIVIECISKDNKNDGLTIKKYEVVSSINSTNNSTTPLQVNVPDAYIIDTNLSDGKVMHISKEFLGGQSFEMGFNSSPSAQEFILLHRNLVNGTILNRFISRVKNSADNKNIKTWNGVWFMYERTQLVDSMSPYKNVVTLIVSTKKGFKYKNAFNINLDNETYKYNTNGRLGSISFGIDISSSQDQAAIWGNYNKTISQIVNGQ